MELFDITELRVGNLITTIKGTKHYKKELEVENIIYNNPNVDESLTLLNGYETNEIRPIPLNEEWLLKLGFDDFGFRRFEKGDFNILKTDLGGFILDTGGIEPYFEHVHQLQNLYYALKGEELTINEI
jgi:hypothetical protein